MTKYLFILACLLFAVEPGFGQKKKSFTVAFYNSENLYDTINDPEADDEEFLPEGKNKWNGYRFEKKLESLSMVIDSLGGGPSILGMCEVENRFVLEELIKTKRLESKNYGIVHSNSPDKRGIDVALIYQKADFVPLFQKAIHVSLESDPDFVTRNILLVKGLLGKQPIYIFVNHWPSRRGGEEESRIKRIAAAKSARFSIDTILKNDPKASILLMGDFNDEPTDVSIKEHLDAGGLTENNLLFNTMAPLKSAGDGSYSYKEHWDMIDQLIVSRILTNKKSKLYLEDGSTKVYRPIWAQDKGARHAGAPFRTYGGPKYLGGFSDHFPVYLILRVH